MRAELEHLAEYRDLASRRLVANHLEGPFQRGGARVVRVVHECHVAAQAVNGSAPLGRGQALRPRDDLGERYGKLEGNGGRCEHVSEVPSAEQRCRKRGITGGRYKMR